MINIFKHSFILSTLSLLLAVSQAKANSVVNGFTVLSQQEALNWVQNFEQEVARSQGRSPRQIPGLEDPRYEPIRKILAKIWRGYQISFPQETSGLSMPIPILIEDPMVNAFAFYRTAEKAIPFLFIIHTGALKADEAQQLGLYAHELAHLITKNLVPEVASSLARYYKVDGAREPLGFLMKNDPTVEAYAKRYIQLSKSVGPIARRSLNGAVIDLFGVTDYGLLENDLINKYITPRQSTNSYCQSSADLKQQILALLMKNLNLTSFVLNLDAPADAELSNLTLKFNEAFDSCIGNEKPDLVKLQAARTGHSIEEQQKLIPAEEVAIFNSAPSILKGFLAITIPREAEYEDIAKNHDLSRTRIYTFEENADEAAVRTLQAIGRSSQDLVSFLYMSMPPADAEKCRAQIANGQIPAYGPLFDPHHSSCYRIYHLGLFEKYLRR